MSEPTELRYTASGISFSALAWGPEDGPLALCLHGYPDTAWTWRFLGPMLAGNGWRVVAPFMRGYAPTELAPDGCYQIGALVRDATESHWALLGDDRAVLIGHDWGAVAAYGGAVADSPWRRVVTLAIPPPQKLLGLGLSPFERFSRGARQLPLSWYMLYQQVPELAERSLDRLIPFLWARWSPGFDAREDLEHVFRALDGPGRRRAAMRYYRALMQPWCRSDEYSADQRRPFSRLTVPVLYMHGVDDGCMRSEFAAGALEALPQGSEMEVVSGAGHFLQLERPDEVNARIAAFIA
jgi:pimeloyl-ACP methyl ester carboxylesterase